MVDLSQTLELMHKLAGYPFGGRTHRRTRQLPAELVRDILEAIEGDSRIILPLNLVAHHWHGPATQLAIERCRIHTRPLPSFLLRVAAHDLPPLKKTLTIAGDVFHPDHLLDGQLFLDLHPLCTSLSSLSLELDIGMLLTLSALEPLPSLRHLGLSAPLSTHTSFESIVRYFDIAPNMTSLSLSGLMTYAPTLVPLEVGHFSLTHLRLTSIYGSSEVILHSLEPTMTSLRQLTVDLPSIMTATMEAWAMTCGTITSFVVLPLALTNAVEWVHLADVVAMLPKLERVKAPVADSLPDLRSETIKEVHLEGDHPIALNYLEQLYYRDLVLDLPHLAHLKLPVLRTTSAPPLLARLTRRALAILPFPFDDILALGVGILGASDTKGERYAELSRGLDDQLTGKGVRLTYLAAVDPSPVSKSWMGRQIMGVRTGWEEFSERSWIIWRASELMRGMACGSSLFVMACLS